MKLDLPTLSTFALSEFSRPSRFLVRAPLLTPV
jgi:hypothetical protein